MNKTCVRTMSLFVWLPSWFFLKLFLKLAMKIFKYVTQTRTVTKMGARKLSDDEKEKSQLEHGVPDKSINQAEKN